MVYMVTFTINVPPMLVYIYHTWILWGIHESSTSKTLRIRISRSPSDKNHHNIPQENAIPRARALSSIKRCQITVRISKSRTVSDTTRTTVGKTGTRHCLILLSIEIKFLALNTECYNTVANCRGSNKAVPCDDRACQRGITTGKHCRRICITGDITAMTHLGRNRVKYRI